MMINPGFTDNVIQLAALVSLVDGQATEEEKNLIVDMGSQFLRTSPDELRPKLNRWIETFQRMGVANNPGVALDCAVRALMPLSPPELHLAFGICESVAFQDEMRPEEHSFIIGLERFVFSR